MIKSMREYLTFKGIFEAVIAEPYKWAASGDYAKYPLYRLDGSPFITPRTEQCYRLSLWNKDRAAQLKAQGQREPQRFLFEPRTPKDADPTEYHPALYTPPGLWKAVADRGGRIGITSGESDMFTLIANGITNVTTLFGENNIPELLPVWLFEDGKALTVNYYPDLDRPGLIAAINMWHTFAKHGMKPGQSFNIFLIPDSVAGAAIKDINDIWRAVKQDKAAFAQQLAKFRRVIPADIVKHLIPKTPDAEARNDFQNLLKNWRNKGALDIMRRDSSFDAALSEITAQGYEIAAPQAPLDMPAHADGTTPTRLWEAIEFALGGMGLGNIEYQSNGWSKNIRCPFKAHEHDSSAPAFALNPATGSWKCPKCGTTGGWKVLAEQIGLRIEDFIRPAADQGGLVPQYPNSATTKTLPNGNPPPPPAKYTIIKGDQLAATSIKQAKEYAADPKDIRGIKVFDGGEFDYVLKGLHKHDLMVIIARTGAGKSTLSLQMALQAAQVGKVGIISPENDPESLYDRALCHLYGVNWQEIYAGRYPDMVSLETMYNDIVKDRKIEIVDEAMPTIEGLVTYVNDSLSSADPLIALCVDSIQNIHSVKAKDIYSRYDNVMTGLQLISRKIPVIATSQANRGPSDRRNKWPVPSDCFGGSVIEFTLKRGLSVWRPYYDYQTGELDDAQMGKVKENLIASGIVDQVTEDTTIIRVVKDRFFPNLGVTRAFNFIRNGAYAIRQLPTAAEALSRARSGPSLSIYELPETAGTPDF